MSGFQIENGWDGKSYKAKVDDHGRLYVVNNHVSHLSHHSTYHKNAFIAPFKCTLQDANELPILFFGNNDSNKDIEVYDLRLSTDSNIEVFLYGTSSYTSGGTVPEIVNMNIGSGRVFEPVLYEGGIAGDLVVDASAEELMASEFLGSYQNSEISLDGAIVMQNGHYISLKAKGASGNKIKGFVVFSIHEAGATL